MVLFILQMKQIFHYEYSNSSRAISLILRLYSGSCSILLQIIGAIKNCIKLSFKTVLEYQLFRNAGYTHIIDVLTGNRTTAVGNATGLD